jgi:adenylosuccinate lyase
MQAGGDRQELHEAIRVHSMEAGKVVKAEGRPNDLLQRIKDDPLFAVVRPLAQLQCRWILPESCRVWL